MIQNTFDIKGSILAVSSIHLYASDLTIFEQQIQKLILEAPDLFNNMPVIIDLSELPETALLDFIALHVCLSRMPLITIGLKNVPQTMLKAALEANWKIMSASKKSKIALQKNQNDSNHTEQSSQILQEENEVKHTTLKVNQPVRSGQQIYNHGDVVLLKMVSAGAEILAGGDIHAYSPIRGRILAGINGNKKAQIFCQSLSAELISIAGYFKLFDQIPNELKGQPVRIYLQDDQLQIELLS